MSLLLDLASVREGLLLMSQRLPACSPCRALFSTPAVPARSYSEWLERWQQKLMYQYSQLLHYCLKGHSCFCLLVHHQPEVVIINLHQHDLVAQDYLSLAFAVSFLGCCIAELSWLFLLLISNISNISIISIISISINPASHPDRTGLTNYSPPMF